jgi:hypothetical protein
MGIWKLSEDIDIDNEQASSQFYLCHICSLLLDLLHFFVNKRDPFIGSKTGMQAFVERKDLFMFLTGFSQKILKNLVLLVIIPFIQLVLATEEVNPH